MGSMSAKSGPACPHQTQSSDFLRRTAIGLTGVAHGSHARAADLPEKLSSPTAPHSLVGSNVYGWGQYAQRDHKSLVIEDVILAALRDTGYDYLEANLDVSRPTKTGTLPSNSKRKGFDRSALRRSALASRRIKQLKWSRGSSPPQKCVHKRGSRCSAATRPDRS